MTLHNRLSRLEKLAPTRQPPAVAPSEYGEPDYQTFMRAVEAQLAGIPDPWGLDVEALAALGDMRPYVQAFAAYVECVQV